MLAFSILNLSMKIAEAQETGPPEKVVQCCQLEQPPPYLIHTSIQLRSVKPSLLTSRVYVKTRLVSKTVVQGFKNVVMPSSNFYRTKLLETF